MKHQLDAIYNNEIGNILWPNVNILTSLLNKTNIWIQIHLTKFQEKALQLVFLIFKLTKEGIYDNNHENHWCKTCHYSKRSSPNFSKLLRESHINQHLGLNVVVSHKSLNN